MPSSRSAYTPDDGGSPQAPAPPENAAPPDDHRLDLRARLVLGVLCAAQFIISLDFSILNIALPVLGHDLGMGPASLQWAVTAFALPAGGFLLLFGRLGDLFGRRRMFLLGIALFTLASVLATIAGAVGWFLAARAAQGLGAAAVIPTGLALITSIFPEGPARNRALGVNATVLSLGFTVGMLIGGVMTEVLGWRSTMLLLAVAGAVISVLALSLLPESRPKERPRLDVPGAVTVSVGLLAVIYGLSTAAAVQSFGRADIVVALVLGVLLLAAFVVVERRVASPLVSLGLLRRPTVAFGNLGGFTTFSMMSSTIFLLTLYLQDALGLDALQTGLFFGGQGVVLLITGSTAPAVIGRLGSRAVLVGGLVVQAVGTALLVTVVTEGNALVALLVLCAASVGHMSAVVSYGVTATSALTNEEQGLATGLVTSAQQLGITTGIPVLGALLAAQVIALTARGENLASATLVGVRYTLVADAALVGIAVLVIGLGLLRVRRHQPA